MTQPSPHSTPREAARIFAATPANIEDAARRLRAGALVALPTETVYGLGANALDESAVARIFEVKGRPSANPLIVHVASTQSARKVVREWPREAQMLAERFWPGPLTLVLARGDDVPRIVTAGLDAVGVRVPAHPVALQVLGSADVPIAAPSANRSEAISPTTAEHVRQSLGEFLDGARDMILDGGACRIGIESSVLDLTQRTPVLLRAGGTSRVAIEEVIGPIRLLDESALDHPIPSPGQMARHYAPRARAVRFESRQAMQIALTNALHQAPKYLGLIVIGSVLVSPRDETLQRVMPGEASAYAREIYAALHEMDGAQCQEIWIEMPPEREEWRAVRDRLGRATVEQ